MSGNGSDDRASVLEIAWQHYAELDANASAAARKHLRLRAWVIILAVVATFLAILSYAYGELLGSPGYQIVRVALVLVPITGSIILAFANKFQQGERWLALRSGAEEIKKEIYLYRTVLQRLPERREWLNDRLAAIQRQAFESAGGELVLTPYTGPVPPYYRSEDKHADPGFKDLLAEEYVRYRLADQLAWHTREINRQQHLRTRLQVAIFVTGGLSTFLAAMGGIFNVWVALTSSITSALTAWIELRRMEAIIHNYSQIILELTVIQDHWQSLNPEERTGEEFFKLVNATEKVLWSQHRQYVTEMRRAVAELQGKEVDPVGQVMDMPVPPAIDTAVKAEAVAAAIPADETVEPAKVVTVPVLEQARETQESLRARIEKPRKGVPHAFVVMPFGTKQASDGRWLDFNSIYYDLIKPALEEAGFEPFRADEETVSGDILTDMFQELLLADLVIADLSIDNANVFYELGIRHALRKRGVIHIQSGRAYLPFDIFNVRTLPYQLDKNGRPDQKSLEKDRQAIIKLARETYASDRERVHSPIFNLLDGLAEPDHKMLRTPLATGYWREYYDWQERVAIARRQKRVGDILLLTEEVNNPLIQEEVIAEAGRALKSGGHYALALQQYRRGLKLNPKNSEFRREEAFHLGRLKQVDEAIVKLERLLYDEPDNVEAMAYLGRIYKEIWQDQWLGFANEKERLQEAYEAAHWLKKAIDIYLSAYRLDQRHYYSGTNALLLSLTLDHLAGEVGAGPDTDLETIRQKIPLLKGAIQFALETEAARDTNNFWVFVSLGDVAVYTARDPRAVANAYKRALTLAGKNRFALGSTLAQLELMETLKFRPDFVKAGIEVIQAELQKYQAMEAENGARPGDDHPPQVFLFSGHMIDREGRREPRFPAGMEEEARNKIEQALDKLAACSQDMAYTAGAACGGDILFIEACLRRRMRVEVLLPFDAAGFIAESVAFAGDEWVERFYAILNHPLVALSYQPDRLGPLPKEVNPYERNNLWALYSTLCYGIQRVRLVVLWDGKGGDGPGGTGHMVQEVRRLGGVVEHINTTKFDYWQTQGKVSKALDTLVTAQ